MSNLSSKKYLALAKLYEDCFYQFGDSAEGMGWPSETQNRIRFQILLDLFRKELTKKKKVTILDFGCGVSHFYNFLQEQGLSGKVRYTGVDIIESFIEVSQKKYPQNKYLCMDILKETNGLEKFDYIIINGVFTQKHTMTQSEMQKFLLKTLRRLFPHCRHGLAFNTMSEQVDFKRRGAFHVDLDWASSFLCRNFTRNFIIRHDYNLYENTFYLFKKAQVK